MVACADRGPQEEGPDPLGRQVGHLRLQRRPLSTSRTHHTGMTPGGPEQDSLPVYRGRSSTTSEVAEEMVWAVLALLGVPLWLCAVAILALLYRNRSLRRRPGDIPVRVLRPGKTRWVRGHAGWLPTTPHAWTRGREEDLCRVVSARSGSLGPGERKRLRGLGRDAAAVTLRPDAGPPFAWPCAGSTSTPCWVRSAAVSARSDLWTEPHAEIDPSRVTSRRRRARTVPGRARTRPHERRRRPRARAADVGEPAEDITQPHPLRRRKR